MKLFLGPGTRELLSHLCDMTKEILPHNEYKPISDQIDLYYFRRVADLLTNTSYEVHPWFRAWTAAEILNSRRVCYVVSDRFARFSLVWSYSDSKRLKDIIIKLEGNEVTRKLALHADYNNMELKQTLSNLLFLVSPFKEKSRSKKKRDDFDRIRRHLRQLLQRPWHTTLTRYYVEAITCVFATMIPWDDHQFDYPLAATMSLAGFMATIGNPILIEDSNQSTKKQIPASDKDKHLCWLPSCLTFDKDENSEDKKKAIHDILLSRLRIPVVAAEILSGGWLRIVGQTSKDGAMIIGSKTYLLTPDEKHIFDVVDNTTQEQGITKLKWFTLGS